MTFGTYKNIGHTVPVGRMKHCKQCRICMIYFRFPFFFDFLFSLTTDHLWWELPKEIGTLSETLQEFESRREVNHRYDVSHYYFL